MINEPVVERLVAHQESGPQGFVHGVQRGVDVDIGPDLALFHGVTQKRGGEVTRGCQNRSMKVWVAFNALAAAKDFASERADVTVLFQGAGTRWTGLLADVSHPLHALYATVRPNIAGASDACSTFFGARDAVGASGLPFVTENVIDGVGGLPSLASLADAGYAVLAF